MNRQSTRGWIFALVVALLCGKTTFATEGPADIELELNPQEIAELECTISIPCDTSPPKADIYIVADTTQSMNAVLEAVADTVDELVDTLLGTQGVDVRMGIGNYRDFPEKTSEFAFEHQLSMTDDAQAIKDALQDWEAGFLLGGDKAEGQFYAMTKIVTDPTIGFRTGADVKRIIVWFGDSPAHDPVCEAIHGDATIPYDITENTLIAELLGSGEGGTTVIAISTRIGVPGALDVDPDPFSMDYEGICEIDGNENQATNIADATDGIHIEELPAPEEITPVILEAVDTVLRRVDATIEISGEIEPFVVSVEPEIYKDVVVPVCPDEDLVLTFTITLEGQHCIENMSEFKGLIQTFVDDDVYESKTVNITQPLCAEAACFLIIGARKAEILASGDPADVLLLKPKRPRNEWIIPVTMETIPDFEVPDDPSLEGKHIYMQVYMNNPIDFPGNPIQLSNGLDITIGSNSIPVSYGPANTIDLWALTPTPLGGKLQLQFSIDGL